MITLDYRGSQNYTGSKPYPEPRRWLPLHNSYHRFVVQLIKTMFFKPFLSDMVSPKYPYLKCEKRRRRWRRDLHDFAMLILKARHEIGQIQAEECFSWCDAWYTFLLLRVHRHRQNQLISDLREYVQERLTYLKKLNTKVFQEQVVFSVTIKPICLPPPVTYFIFN